MDGDSGEGRDGYSVEGRDGGNGEGRDGADIHPAGPSCFTLLACFVFFIQTQIQYKYIHKYKY